MLNNTTAQVDFTASVKTSRNLSTNDQFNLEITTSHNGKYTPPNLDGFKVINTGQQQFSSAGYNNGQYTRKTSIVLTYTLEAKRAGKITIGSASIVVKGKTYKTTPITLDIAKGVAPPNGAGFDGKSKVIARVTTSKSEVYQGESLTITYKIYTPYRFTQIAKQDIPSYKNFVKHSLLAKNLKKYNVKEERINGRVFQTITLERSLLVPGSPGNYTLDPFDVEVVLTDSWGWNTMSAKASSNKPTIKVKALPEAGKPDQFTGAVGSFKILAEVANDSLKEGDDGTDLKITISGIGDPDFDDPTMEFPSEFDSYPPEKEDDFKASTKGIKITRSWNYYIVPLANGSFELGPFKFSYFDPNTGQYKTISSEPIELKINNPQIQEKRLAKESKRLGIKNTKELRYIHLEDNLTQGEQYITDSPWFWIGISAPAIAFFLLLFIKRNKDEDTESQRKQKQAQKAAKLARQQLQEAKRLIDEGKYDAFYVENLRALYGYLSKKLGMMAHEMDKQSIKETLLNRSVSETTVKEFIHILEDCELARYGSIQQEPSPLYETSMSKIIDVENQLI